ncbi:alpha/beta hydrolase fold [Burkholderia sp. D7]|nr:alpha/beta hydrolase fold [Burkholderia sp. D7]
MRVLKLAGHNAMLRFHDIPGSGTPLVFIHGLGCASSRDYPQVIADPALTGRRSILVDLLGSGYSDRPERFGYRVEDHARIVVELIESLEREVDLFGHSMGGTVAIVAATMAPREVRRLVLAEPNLDAGGGLFSHALRKSVKIFCSTSTSRYDDHPASAGGQRRCPQHEAVGSRLTAVPSLPTGSPRASPSA